MAQEQNAGSIVYTVSADIDPLLIGGKQAIDALGKMDAAAQQSGKGFDDLDKSTSNTGSSFTELAGYANSMDNQLRKLNTNVSGIARAMADARTGTGSASSEFSRAESIIEALGNQLAILEEAEEGSARSAAILAAQLRAGSKATDEEKQKIGELTGRLFDMKNSVDSGAKGHTNWKNSMQQAGYQVQDFIVQVQGGQSALVAFSQQGSQLAGAFGPGGAVVGAIIAFSSVIAGTLITSLNGGKSAMDALKDAAEAMDKVINISINGVAALSDKYAYLAKTNAEVATLMRNQALLEYNEAIGKIPKAISDASSSLLSFSDKALSAFSGGYASVDGFNDRLASLNITTDDYTQAIKQAYGAGQAFQATANSIGNTVGAVADKFGISEQQAFEFSKQLSDIAKNPSPEALQRLATELQNTQSSTEKGQTALTAFVGKLVDLSREAVVAKGNVAALKEETDNLTAGQKNLIKQSERSLALSKLQGEARARLQAQYAAEDAGLSKDDPHTKQMEADAAATYKNTQAQKTLQSEQKKGASQVDSIAQKLEQLRQKSELSADSTQELSREQSILSAQLSLGASATKEQIALAGQLAAKAYDNAAALKAQQKAEKERQETEKSYKQAQISASPVAGIDNQFQQQMAALNNYAALYPQKIEEVEALRASIEDKYRQQREAAMWQEFSQMNAGTQAIAAAIDSLGSTASNAITGILTGTTDLDDALRSVGMTILNSVVNSFVQMGIDWAKSAIMGAAGMSTASAATMAQGAAIAAAMAPAAAMTSLATAGANSVPAQAGITATVGLAQGLSVAGARYNGGPVSGSGLYQVGEKGKPEIFKASNGNQYMIPGDNGSVISNRAMNSGSGGKVPIVNNYVINQSSGAQATTTSSTDGNGNVTIQTIVADLEEGGPISQAFTRNFATNRHATE